MQSTKIGVTLRGIRAIMFDRFVSMKTELAPEDKTYRAKDGNLIFPAKNIMSFLSGQNTESAPKRTMGRKWAVIAKAALSFVDATPTEILFLRDGKPIPGTEVEIVEDKGIVKKGSLAIPSPKQRPVLALPWALQFQLELFRNEDLNEPTLRRLFEEGGMTIGFGTYRGVYGKFVVERWEHL
jgi:hypothetical protein